MLRMALRMRTETGVDRKFHPPPPSVGNVAGNPAGSSTVSSLCRRVIVSCHAKENRALRLLEVPHHVGPDRRSIDLARRRAHRRRDDLLAGRPSAGAGPQRHRARGENPQDINAAPLNARTRVHEYGGGAWTVADGVAYFSSFSDGRLYRQRGAEAPVALTPAPRQAQRLAFRGWHHRQGAQSLDRRARGSHRRRRGGEHHRGGRARRLRRRHSAGAGA